jgi:predicted RNase H-like HicB family nuclease
MNNDSAAADPSRGSILTEVSMREWRQFYGGVYECRALVCPEEEGGFSSFALRLPGVASQGETEEEALLNLKEAFRGALATYIDSGMEIPWGEAAVEHSEKCKERWIMVDVSQHSVAKRP